NVGGYTSFWIDRGSSYVQIDGQKRTSLVIDPPDGKVPQMTAAARERMLANRNAPPTSAHGQRRREPGVARQRSARRQGAADDGGRARADAGQSQRTADVRRGRVRPRPGVRGTHG